MKAPYLLSIFLLFVFISSAVAQSEEPQILSCGHDHLRPSLRSIHIQDSLESIYHREMSFRPFRAGFAAPENSNPPPYVIPVVVHVIHDNGNENISEARVLQGIEWLNQSFANTDYYDQGTGVNTQIQFCLAQRTPDNQPTNGITYHQSPLTNIDNTNDLAMKNLARWDPTQYINIYLVREICTSSCSVAGYAYYPSAHGSAVDGIVMEARWMGQNEAGNAVLTHEMGHSLGLAHTFDGGCANNDCLVDGDRVCDTPPDQSTVAVPCGGSANSCTTDTDSGFATDQNDMFNNYMDYGNFNCYNALTQGQAERMHFFIEGIRASLLSSPGCQTPCPAVVTAGFDQNPMGTSFVVGTTVNFTNSSTNGNGFEWYVNGVLQSSSVDFNLLLDAPGLYTIKLVAAGNPPLCLADSVTVSIQAFCDLNVEYTSNNSDPVLGQEVLFSAPVTGYDSYEWTVNGAVLSNTDELLFLFDQAGIYEVCLSAEEGNCTLEHCSFYFIATPPTTDDCFGPSGVSVYALNAGEEVSAGPLVPNSSGGFWHVLRIDNELVFQEMDATGNILSISSAAILNSGFTRFSGLNVLSDGSLLMSYVESNISSDRTSYFLRYDPVSETVIYRKAVGYGGTIFGHVRMPTATDLDQYLVLYDLSPTETANASNETWLFDINALTGDFGMGWNYQTMQSGPHSISHGLYDQGVFLGVGRITAATSANSYRAGIMRFNSPNNLDNLTLFHRPPNAPARLYGSQLMKSGLRLFSIHNGNPSGSSTENNLWAYLSRWDNQELMATQEFRVSGSQFTAIQGSVIHEQAIYSVARSVSDQSETYFVMSTDLGGNVLWANSYELPIGRIRPTLGAVDCKIYVTNNSLIVPFGLQNSPDGAFNQGAGLMRLNLDGSIADNCVTVTPVDLISEEVEPFSSSLQMQSGDRPLVANDRDNSMIDRIYSQYNGCADTCGVSTGDCGLTGEQFAQVWNNDLEENVQAQAIIADGVGGLVVAGSTENGVFINRLDIDGSPVSTYSLNPQTGTGLAEVVTLDLADNGKLLLGGIIPPRPGMNRTGFFACFDLNSNSLDWWREMDDDAEVMDVHHIPNSGDFILSGSRLWQNSAGNSTPLVQRRSLSNGELTGTLYVEFEAGPESDQILSSVLQGNTLYTATRYTVGSGLAGMRAAVSSFDINSGNEILTMVAGPSTNLSARTYNNSIVVRQNEIYALFRGDLNGIGGTDVSKVYLAKFSTSGTWVWGREYDISNFPGEYGMSLQVRDNDLIISGNGYGPRDLFAMRVSQANGDLVWAKGYHDESGNDLAFNLRGDQSMLVTSSAIFLAAYVETTGGQQYPEIIKLNTAGEAPSTDNCLTAYDLDIQIDDLEPWSEFGLEPWDTPLQDDAVTPVEGALTFDLLTPCLDSCAQPTNTGDCGLTGEQFAQVWDNENGGNTQGQILLSDLSGGLVILGSSDTEVIVSRSGFDGSQEQTYGIEIPSGPGMAEVMSADITDQNKLIICGNVPPRPGMTWNSFICSFDLSTNTLDWWKEGDDNADFRDVKHLAGTTDFILAGSHLNQGAANNTVVLLQRRNVSDGELSGAMNLEYDFGAQSDQAYSLEVVGDRFYTTGRYTGTSGTAGIRASATIFDLQTGGEILSMTAGPSFNQVSRTYGRSIVVNQDEIYVLYLGDIDGTGFTEVSKVYLAKFTTSGAWVWGRQYNFTNHPGEYGVNLRIQGNHLVISGNSVSPDNVFMMRVTQANGDLVWANRYSATNGETLALNDRTDESMLVTSSKIFLTGYMESLGGGEQRPFLISTNTSGQIAESDCFEASPLNIEVTDLPPWQEAGLIEFPATLGTIDNTPDVNELNFDLLTLCLDSCAQDTITEICGNDIDDDNDGFTDCEDPDLAGTCCCLEGPMVTLPNDTIICPNDFPYLIYPLSVSATSNVTYDWGNGDNSDTLVVNTAGTYILIVTDSCGNTTSDEITITTLELPPPPDLGPDLEVCDNGVLNLNAGSGYTSYLWSDFTTDSTVTFYDPGTYWLRVTDACGNEYSDTISIATLPTTILDLPDTIILCPQDSQLVVAPDFATYTWFPIGASCDNCSEITVYAPDLGDTLVYTLLVSNDDGCFSTDSIIVFTVPEEGESLSASICEGEVYDFNGTMITEAGQYTQTSLCGGVDTLNLSVLLPPPVVEFSDSICSGDSLFVFDQWRFTSGIYTDTLVAMNGCDSVEQFTLSVETPPTSTDTIRICEGESVLIFGTLRSEAGDYSMNFALADSPCDSVATVSLFIEQPPTVAIQVNDDECGINTAAVVLSGIPVNTTIAWEDPTLVGFNQELESGVYPFTLTSLAGCTLDSFLVVDIPTSVAFELTGFSPTCPDGADGFILLTPPNMGTLVSINGGVAQATDSLGGLIAGVYSLITTDTLGCISEHEIRIDAPSGFQLLLPQDTIIRLGEAIRINGRLFGIDEAFVDLIWSPTDFLNCDTCLVTTSMPTQSTSYTLLAVDSLGCSRIDSLRISVDKQPRIYVPTAFSPNGDGVNDIFFPNFGPAIEAVELMQIYERWGGMVFERENFPPNDPAFGWDGSVGGKALDPNVFVWHMRVRLLDGRTLDLSGDLTLIR